VDEFLASVSSPQLSEWMAYFTMLNEESQRPAGRSEQTVSGEAAFELMAKHARKRR